MPFDRYSRIRDLMAERLQAKTGWGRNELLSALDTILIHVSEEEIEHMQAAPTIEIKTTPWPTIPLVTCSDSPFDLS